MPVRLNDPRIELRAAYAGWLRVRVNVRALAAKVAAAQHALERDVQRRADPDMATIAAQLGAERRALQALAGDLDARITHVKTEFAAIDSGFVDTLAAAARSRVGKPQTPARTEKGMEHDRPPGA